MKLLPGAIVMSLALAAPVLGQTFTELPGDDLALGLSRDGSTVVGRLLQGGDGLAFTWTRNGGYAVFGGLPQLGIYSEGRAVSDDGRFVGGVAYRSGEEFGAFRYDAQSNTARYLGSLSGLPVSYVEGISSNGNMIVGYGTNESSAFRAFYWTPERGLRAIPGLDSSSQALGVSSDGTKIIGAQFGSGETEAYVWSEAQGPVILEKLGFNLTTIAYAVNSTGNLIAGRANYPDGNRTSFDAVIWQDAQILRRIPQLAGSRRAEAFGLSDDGSVVVGVSYGPANQTAFVWTEATGTVTLRDYLMSFGVNVPEGREFTGPISVSADGRTFAATNGNGFVATVPTPATLATVTMAVLGLRQRRGTSLTRRVVQV